MIYYCEEILLVYILLTLAWAYVFYKIYKEWGD